MLHKFSCRIVGDVGDCPYMTLLLPHPVHPINRIAAMDSTAIFFTIENDFRFMLPPPLTFVYHTP